MSAATGGKDGHRAPSVESGVDPTATARARLRARPSLPPRRSSPRRPARARPGLRLGLARTDGGRRSRHGAGPRARRSRGPRAQRPLNARRLPFADASFDAVVCFEAIEHVTEPERLVAEVRRVLRAPALFVVSTPDRRLYTERAGHRNPHHVCELTRSEFETLLRRRFEHVGL
ncbi:MAG: class I SAM-dependent methyltransferase [Myxococcota bacterium]